MFPIFWLLNYPPIDESKCAHKRLGSQEAKEWTGPLWHLSPRVVRAERKGDDAQHEEASRGG